MDDLPPALVADVLKVTRCKGDSRGRMSAAVVAYAGDGRPVRLDWVKSSLRDECDRAARALLLTSLVGGARRTGEAKDLVVLPVSERFLDCLATTGPAEKPYRVGWDPRLRERIEPPKKVADLRPHYPPALQESRTQGIVILDAAITTTGCVRQLRVLKSVDPGLDIESAYAVANWAFTPTRLDGKPVPVSMTVTVQFSLR